MVGYIADEALRGSRLSKMTTAVYKVREDELLYVLRKLLDLRLWPGTLWAALSDSPSRYCSSQPELSNPSLAPSAHYNRCGQAIVGRPYILFLSNALRDRDDEPPHSRPRIGAPDMDGKVIEVDARAWTKECLRVLGKEMGALLELSMIPNILADVNFDDVPEDDLGSFDGHKQTMTVTLASDSKGYKHGSHYLSTVDLNLNTHQVPPMDNSTAVRRNPSRASTKSSKNAQSLSSIHEDEVEASASDQLYDPKHDRMKSLPSKEGHTPIGRKKKGSSTSSKQKTHARKADPNNVAGSTKPHTLTQLEYAWGLRYSSLNLDTRFNVFFSSKVDWHTLFDRGLWLLIPQSEDLETLRIRTTSNKNAKGRRKVNIDGGWEEETTFEYHVLCMPNLKEPIHRFDGPEKDAGYTVHGLPFPNLGPSPTGPLILAQLLGQLAETLAQISHETPQSARNRLDMILALYAEWMQLGIPTGFTGSGDGNKPDHASRPPSERAPSADGDGDEPDDGSNSTGTESESEDNAEVSTPSKKPTQGRRNAMDIQSQSSDTQESVMDDDEWGSSEETAWIEEICDWAEKCREATSSEAGWEPDAVNDDQMAAYAKEPSRPAPPPESWNKWRPRWEPRIGNQPQFFNTAKFSSNDWAIYEGRGPLTGFAR
ncbi:hypothetical protein BU15DRAFT_76892 [Melanogaster broomeanus]|nr:hypothetical protein BU15DRAFT_76892 [Melanogaster broomeanus]